MCNTIPIYSIHLCELMLYRVREDVGVDTSRPSSFSYNPNPSLIKRLRFNKPGEQVLYTSTYPTIAVAETIQNSQCRFYISKWKNKSDHLFNSFVAVDNNCSDDPSSHSRKAREAICSYFSPYQLVEIDKVRSILEKDYTHSPEGKQYLESSECASKILEVADCIVSYSAKDSRYLNVTFNKFAVDNYLELDTVYYCDEISNPLSMTYKVLSVGRKIDDSIKWFSWDVDKKSIRVADKSKGKYSENDLQFIISQKNYDFKPYCNVNKALTDYHQGILEYMDTRIFVEYCLKLY